MPTPKQPELSRGVEEIILEKVKIVCLKCGYRCDSHGEKCPNCGTEDEWGTSIGEAIKEIIIQAENRGRKKEREEIRREIEEKLHKYTFCGKKTQEFIGYDCGFFYYAGEVEDLLTHIKEK